MKKMMSILLAAVCCVSLLASCGGKDGGASAPAASAGSSVPSEPIAVGSKDFTESFILAELYALALEDKGYTVERKFNLGGTNVTQTSLLEDELDVYPEYTGTCLLNVLQADLMTDPDEVYNYVKEAYASEYQLAVLQPAEASNAQGLAITTEASEAYGIKTVSDLQANADKIRFACLGPFLENADSMPALEAAYGEFNFGSLEIYDNAIKYELLRQGEADLTVAFTTDGQLSDPIFTVLEDDKQVWPPYNIVPIARQDTLAEYPEMEAALNAISAKLDMATMQKLNAEVDINKREAVDVAKEFYDATF